ncbi:MAG: hypothetical protein Q9218_003867 [Villophora microphyllina]
MTTAILFGSTGAVGQHVLSTLLDTSTFTSIQTISRRLPKPQSPKLHVTQEAATSQWPALISTLSPTPTTVFNALGTSRALAGSLAEQWKIDHDLCISLAHSAKASGVKTFVFISSAGTRGLLSQYVPYSKMKVGVEDAIRDLEFENAIVLRPGFILGARERPKAPVAEMVIRNLHRVSWGLQDSIGQDQRIIGRAAVAAARIAQEGKAPSKFWVLEQADVVKIDAQKSIMTFYDIASGHPIRPFAPNPWKARYALNFTKVPYCTTWVPLPDVAATRKKLGVPASRKHADGTDFLTLPILYELTISSSTQQEGTFVGDSFDIAIHLHNKHSSPDREHPPLFPPNSLALHRTFNAHVDALFSLNGAQLAGFYMPFDPATAEATRADFARRAGVSRWEDLEIPQGSEERKKKLATFEAALESGPATWFVRRDEGPFLEGGTPMYADLIVGGWLQMMRNCLLEWGELRGWHRGLWGILHDALEEWTEVFPVIEMSSKYKGESVLDRAEVELGTPGAASTENKTVDNDLHMSKRERFSGKVKSLLHISNDQINDASNVDYVVLAASPNVTPGEPRLDEGEPPNPQPQGFQQLVQHPVDTIKAKTQRKTNKEVAANLLSPEVTHAQDVALIHAQDTLDTAKSDSDIFRACEDLETLKKARQDLYVRWTMDRHVQKLRRLESKSTQGRKQNEVNDVSLRKCRELGWKRYGQELVLQQAEKYGGQYIGSFSEPPPASQETVSASLERLLIASTPWQELIMHTRRIYRWENQKETSAYLVTFVALWAYGALCAAGVRDEQPKKCQGSLLNGR